MVRPLTPLFRSIQTRSERGARSPQRMKGMGRSTVAMVGPAATGLADGALFLVARDGGDMALPCALQTGNQSQARGFLVNSDFAVRTGPMPAVLARIHVCLLEREQPGVVGAAHRYPD